MVTKASVDAVFDKIDGFVAAEMDHVGTPGVAVSVVYDDAVPLTHVDANTFSAVLFPKSPNDRSAITFTVDDGTATVVDIGDGDGPGTGQLTRRTSRGHGPRDRRGGDGRRSRESVPVTVHCLIVEFRPDPCSMTASTNRLKESSPQR